MSRTSRREFLRSTVAGSAATLLAGNGFGADGAPSTPLRMASFRFDVTPPLGHPLCGGWISPALAIVDPLEAIGFVILGAGQPIVVCAVDWTGILNDAHIAWRTTLANAAGTTPDRVAVQCVHQHDALFVCPRADRLAEEAGHGLDVVDMDFFRTCLERAARAVKAALPSARPLTHIATGESVVQQVASNRRVSIGPDGKVGKMRGSSCRDADLVALPEGLIDPRLKTVAFYSRGEKMLACHYYATHPMSHYGKGQVSSDFAGLARKQRQRDEPGCTHIYFTGAAGNIAAGKYNNGSPEARLQLTERMYQGMVASEKTLQPVPLKSVIWKTSPLLPPPDPSIVYAEQRTILNDATKAKAPRSIAAMRLSWKDRFDGRAPILLSALHLDSISLLHLPAESFVEYQLRAQAMQPGRFIATAAYGDGGPWYIPVKAAYPEGGYEVSVAFCSPEIDDLLTKGIRDVLKV